MKSANEFAVRKLAKRYERQCNTGDYLPVANMYMFLKALLSEFGPINIGIQTDEGTGVFVFVQDALTKDTVYSTNIRDARLTFQ